MDPVRILKVNLTTGNIETTGLAAETRREYIGGMGLACRLLWDAEAYKAEPLSPDNTFVLAVGPLAGTIFPGSSRFETAFRSPLTGGIGYASAGGFLAPEMKNTGFDAICITGASETPVYLFVKDGAAELRDASKLWGLDTYATEDALREELADKRVRVAAIGPAGENLVKFAAVMSGRHNYAARGGPGAVLGSKKLKAIVVRGTKKRTVADKDLYDATRKRIKEKLETDVSVKTFSDFGTDGAMSLGMMITDVPTKNWRVADWTEGSDKLNGVTMADTILTGRKSCHACSVGCKRVVTVKDGKYKTENDIGPEYETAASMGTLLLNDDLAAVTAANKACNMLGLDTISCGSTLACAFEAFDRGLISEKDTGGLKLKWGDIDTALKLMDMISRREGIGDKLAEGTKRFAASLGKGAEELAINGKGLELPMHDPRAYHSLALAYAMSNRGACHTKHLNIVIEMGAYTYPDFKVPGPYDPLSRDNKAQMTIGSENIGIIVSSLVLCMFPAYALDGKDFSDMIASTEGLRMSVAEINQAAERIWCVQRAFNVMCGLTAEDDSLPKRVLSPHVEGKPSGLDKIVRNITGTQLPSNPTLRRNIFKTYDYILPHQTTIVKLTSLLMFFKKLNSNGLKKKGTPDLEFMKKEYYKIRDLDSRFGAPSTDKMKSLNLTDVEEKMRAAM